MKVRRALRRQPMWLHWNRDVGRRISGCELNQRLGLSFPVNVIEAAHKLGVDVAFHKDCDWAASLESDSRGLLKVNSMYQTALSHIYAVGDVIGYPSLASAAYDQGRIAAQAIASGEASGHLIEDIPTGIYTIPEISSVGKTEQELTAMKVPYEVGRAQFKHLARAQIAGMNVGSLKILFHRDTLQILGIHCFGERAAEIIHIGQAIMEQKGEGNTIEYFVNTTFNYPTMAEAYRVAALNGLNRLF